METDFSTILFWEGKADAFIQRDLQCSPTHIIMSWSGLGHLDHLFAHKGSRH